MSRSKKATRIVKYGGDRPMYRRTCRRVNKFILKRTLDETELKDDSEIKSDYDYYDQRIDFEHKRKHREPYTEDELRKILSK